MKRMSPKMICTSRLSRDSRPPKGRSIAKASIDTSMSNSAENASAKICLGTASCPCCCGETAAVATVPPVLVLLEEVEELKTRGDLDLDLALVSQEAFVIC